MFGLTKREQRWKAEQAAAELLVELSRIKIDALVQVALVKASRDAEIIELQKQVAMLQAAKEKT